jgi:two-component system chemotaxis sensor kinase CheA
MSDSDLKLLILNPEFSTVIDTGRKPEDRGEGLHIVKTNIEKLKGSIDIRSEAGQGTQVQIRVPLNLLVVKALQVKAGEEVMALPVSCIEEILRVRTDVIFEEDGNKVIKIHDTTLPVFKLTEVFNIEPVEAHDERVYIIIVQAEGQSIGLIVDETAGLEEIVIKPLGEFLRKESGFSGATIISDGNISLIPDIAELIRIAKERRPVPEESIA